MFGFPLQYGDNSSNNEMNTSSSQAIELDNIQEIQSNVYSRQSKAKHLSSQLQEFTNTNISSKMKANTPEPQFNRNEIVKLKLKRVLNNSNSGINRIDETDQNSDKDSNLKKLLCMLNKHNSKAAKPAIPKIMYNYNQRIRECTEKAM